MSDTVAFPDTNVFLHYRELEQVDWLDLLHAESVTIMVAPIVIRELNKYKESGERKKIRHRAGSALKKLKAFLQPAATEIRTGVEVRFRESDPIIDFESCHLSRELADDWLLATMLEFQKDFPGRQVVLVTGDVGLQLQVKAGIHQLPCIELPEEMKLPEEIDPDQKQIQELEAELRAYRRRVPDLHLRFEHGRDHFRFRLSKLPRITDDEVSRKTAEVRAAHPKVPKPDGYSGADLLLGGIGPADIDRHNGRLEIFYAAHEKYMRILDEVEDTQRRLIQLPLVLFNDGFCPAEDIDVYVDLPDGLRVAEDAKTFCKFPEEPKAPQGPKSTLAESFERAGVGLDLSRLDMIANFDQIHAMNMIPRNVSHPRIRRTNSFEVRIHVEELKHNLQVELDPLFVVFDSWDTARPFTIDYKLLAANVPEPVTGQLHAIIEVAESN